MEFSIEEVRNIEAFTITALKVFPEHADALAYSRIRTIHSAIPEVFDAYMHGIQKALEDIKATGS